jgi:hypothetical protein
LMEEIGHEASDPSSMRRNPRQGAVTNPSAWFQLF